MDNFLRQTTAVPVTARADGAHSLVPPKLSGYRTGRLLGAGGSASVWLVEDQGSGTVLALKVFAGSQANADGEPCTQLYRESVILEGTAHPHLLGLRGAVTTDQGPAILMEYAGGGSLLNLVAVRKRLGVGECVTVLAPIAQALAHLHSESVEHGDVSPGNVLFTSEGKPLLADLGMGRLLGETGTGAQGTAGFADPVRRSGPRADYSSDVYSLAAIGWYALTGDPPPAARERPPLSLLVPEVPSELLHVLEAGLSEDRKERPSASELADSVLRAATPQPLDLVAAVHPSVLPELLTRRVAGSQIEGARNRIRLTFRRPPTPLPSSRRSPSGPGAAFRRAAGARARKLQTHEPKRRRGRRRAAPGRADARNRWKASVPRTVAMLLVLCGALLFAPHSLDSLGSARERAADAGRGSLPSIPADGPQLSPEIRERLGDDDPVRALSALVAVRAMVLSTADSRLLSHVNVEQSAAMAADRELVSALTQRGRVFHGLSIRLREAALTQSAAVSEGKTAVAATTVMSGYTEMDSTGAVVRTVAESPPQELLFVLERQGKIWKIAGVYKSDAV